MEPQRTLHLADGFEIPSVGYGTYDVTGEDTYPSVRTALEVGYRHIDTAHGYGNEAEIGRALADSAVDRDDVFLTSKLPPWRVGEETETLEASLTGLRTDCLDLWLIHAPPPDEQIVPLWEFFVAAREKGKARSIGVSNFSLDQIDTITAATGVSPVVDQIRWSPALYDEAMVRGCADREIVIEGFSAVRRTDLDDPTLVHIARNHGVTTAQVLHRWHLDRDIVTLPRSVRPSRIEENFDLWGFALSPEELAVIDAMSLSD